MCIGEIQSKTAGAEVNSDLPLSWQVVQNGSFLTYFAAEKGFCTEMSEGRKQSVVLSSCAPQKASAITKQVEELFLRGKNNWEGKRNAENMREMQRISQS